MARTAFDEVDELDGALPSCVISDAFDGPDIVQFLDDRDRLIHGPWARQESLDHLAELADDDDPPIFAALVHAGPVTHLGEPMGALFVESFEQGLAHGNLTYRPFRISPEMIDVVDGPVFLQTIPNLLGR